MDRIVWLIVLTVVANFILEFSGVLAQTKDSQSYGHPNSPAYRAANNINVNDVELVDPIQTAESESNGRASSRNKLFDNIFKVWMHQKFDGFITYKMNFINWLRFWFWFWFQIPISTLQAVNDLLQGIGGSFSASG